MLRRGSLIVVLCSLVCLPASADPRRHVVVSGDTLGALALRYDVTIDQLRAWNGLTDDTIQTGQRLAVEPEHTVRHRVIPGDTLRCIARRYRTSVAQIVEDNPSVRRRLDAGTVLTLRGASPIRVGGATRTVTVAEGDTLSSLAERHGVSLTELERANGERDLDPLRVGTELTVPGAAPVLVTVAEGDTLSALAVRHHVTLAQLAAWNPEIDPDRLRVGTELSVGTATASESVGAAYCGHIEGSVPLGEHDAYVLRNPERSYATRRTVQRLRGAFDMMHRAYPQAARVRVHDLSLRGGGPIDDHRSHQSGRDVDITYYRRRGCSAREGCPLETTTASELDVRRQWTLLRHWLRRDEVEAIYVDYSLQRALHREARRRGASEAELRRWFQFPRGPRDADGIIRHFPNHVNHFHVRFACARGERRCRE